MTLARFHTIAELRASLDRSRSQGLSVGLVPTMGALHDGHGSLIEAAAATSNVVVTTIFVNPLQFGPSEDFSKYPRTLDADAEVAAAAGATVLFAPSVDEMYPGGPTLVRTSVHVAGITDVLDGASRPGHFDGVATVVTKLFSIVGPCRALFGEKDFQQLAVIRAMTNDLSLPVDVIGCPTVREPHGLAMSSRNRYLTDTERAEAAVIYRSLLLGQSIIEAGEQSASTVEEAMRAELSATSAVSSIDYASIVDPVSFEHAATITGEVRLLIAARVGAARLIDNIGAIPGRARPNEPVAAPSK
jgi:pantoate--beta-alanine ligase